MGEQYAVRGDTLCEWRQGQVRREGVQLGDAEVNEECLGDVDRRDAGRIIEAFFRTEWVPSKSLVSNLMEMSLSRIAAPLELLTACACKARMSSAVTFPVAWASA